MSARVDLNTWETGGPLGSRSARATQGEKKWSVFRKPLLKLHQLKWDAFVLVF